MTVTVTARRTREADGRGAALIVVGQGRRTDRYVGASIEQLDRRAAVACRPPERHTEQADGGPAAMTLHALGEPEGVSGRVEVVVGLERLEIAYEEEIAAALDVDKSGHEAIVRVEAACEDER